MKASEELPGKFSSRQAQYEPGYGWRFVESKTSSDHHTIKPGEGALQALREPMERQQCEQVAAGRRAIHGSGSLSHGSSIQIVRHHLTPAKGYAVSALPSHRGSPVG